MISSARLRMEFIDCTHSIWSDAFRASSTPSASAICSMIRLHLSRCLLVQVGKVGV